MRTRRIIFAILCVAALPVFAAKPGPVASPDRHPTREELIPPPSDHPEDHKWFITTYVKGTPEQVKGTLDKEIVEFAKKIGEAKRELKTLSKRLDDEKQALAGAEPGSAESKKLDAAIARTKSELTEIEDRISRFRATADKSLTWRKKLIEALVTTVAITGPIKAGESNGILGDVTVQAIEGDDVRVQFDLFENKRSVKAQEGMVSVVRTGKRVPVLIRGLGDRMERLKPGDVLHLYNVFSVTATQPVKPTGRVLIVEPMASDLDYLLAEIMTPPDIEKIAAGEEETVNAKTPRTPSKAEEK